MRHVLENYFLFHGIPIAAATGITT